MSDQIKHTPRIRLETPTVNYRDDILDGLSTPPYESVAGIGVVPDPIAQTRSSLAVANLLNDRTAFFEWVVELRNERDNPKPGRVPALNFWIIDDDADQAVGFINLRLGLNDYLLNYGGHVGYSVFPQYRRRGYATAALSAILPIAAREGIERLLVTCVESNVGSAAVIEACGGVLEDRRAPEGAPEPFRRYWIDTAVHAAAVN